MVCVDRIQSAAQLWAVEGVPGEEEVVVVVVVIDDDRGKNEKETYLTSLVPTAKYITSFLSFLAATMFCRNRRIQWPGLKSIQSPW